jgi:four helix bundle protein
MMSEGKSVLKEKSFLFALESVRIYKILESRKEYVLSRQFLRSGTSVGANIREAQNAESKADFIHKFGIAQKECDETLYWLELIYKSGYLEQNEFESISSQGLELLRILKSSILTSKKVKRENS